MRLPRFEYLEPKDLDQALQMLAQYKDDAKILAGGTDLLVRMKKRLLMPKKLISLKILKLLSHITQNKKSISIGACTSLAQIIESTLIQKEFPALFSAMKLLGAPTIQHYTGTIGGNILQDNRCIHYNQSKFHRSGRQPCHKDGGKICYAREEGDRCYSTCQSDGSPALIALDAKVVLEKKGSKREENLEHLYTQDGIKPFDMDPDELLTQIIIPKKNAKSSSSYKRLAYRSAIDYPIASAAVMIDSQDGQKINSARVVVGSMSRAPLFLAQASSALEGKGLDDEKTFKKASDIAMDNASTFAVHNAGSTLEYRCSMISVLVERACKEAAQNILNSKE